MPDFEMVIGLEVHVQLLTQSKLFCGCSTKFGEPPNHNTCPICLAMPGVLPKLNRRAVEFAIRTALATGCTVNLRSRFARKNYFYPDLPKGYQISQYEEPLAEHGHLDVETPGPGGAAVRKRVGIIRIHMEEDAGKSLHENAEGGQASLIDLNRAGVPLMEIVSAPDLRSAEEATEYLKSLRNIVRCLGVSDGNMQEGSFRCDANVSIRPRGSEKFGTRAELKNINSFKFVERAIAYEARRQEALILDGGKVKQETRLFDPDEGVSRPMRSKEEAHDYRYFPEPDLLPLEVSNAWIDEIRRTLPELPVARRERFLKDYGHSQEEASTLTADRALADYFEAVAKKSGDPRSATNWIKNELLRELNAQGKSIEQSPISAEALCGLLELLSKGTISGKIAKDVFAEMYATGKAAQAIVQEKNLVQIADTGAIRSLCEEVVAANPKQAGEFKAGKQAVLGFLVGQVMKRSQGKANPQMVNDLLREILSNP